MQKYTRTLAIILAGALTLINPGMSAFADGWMAPSATTAVVGQSVISINEIAEFNWGSRREAIKWGVDYAHTEAYVCHEPTLTGPCDLSTSGFNFFGSNVLVPCEDAKQEDCLDEITITTEDGRVVKAKHIGNAGGAFFDAIPSLGLQKAGPISLWRAEGVNHAGGTDTYAAAFTSRQDWSQRDKRFETVSFSATLTPYNELRGSYKAPREYGFKNALGYNQVGGEHGDDICAWSGEGLCGVRQDFAGNPTISAKFRASSELGGWFRGRMSHTQVAIEPFSAANFAYSISGQAVTVPRFAVYATEANTSTRVKNLFPIGSGGSGKELFEGNSGKGAFSTDGYTNAPYTIIEDFRTAVNDTASGISRLWSFESISENSNESCLAEKGRVLGIVTTDATAYDGVAPKFENGQLTYKVSGLHFAPDGKTLNEGTYDLVMRSDVARCLYGFSKAPISATISVVGEGGENKVATVLVNEKDGWLKMAAYGFTFSSPTITVKLSQAAAPAKKATITCTKGKLTKKVTGVAPKCPKGYKKKP